jgi:Leucine-rich repeat (LRR) protein
MSNYFIAFLASLTASAALLQEPLEPRLRDRAESGLAAIRASGASVTRLKAPEISLCVVFEAGDDPELEQKQGAAVSIEAGLIALRALVGWPGISLTLRGNGVFDSALARVDGLDDVRELQVEHTSITDTGLAKLNNLKGLQRLYMFNNKISCIGLQTPGGLSSLRDLSLIDTGVTDDGMSMVGLIDSLQKLELQGSGVTDRGLGSLQQLHNLRHLTLVGNDISGKGLRRLSQ